jgi:hypothetical protein
VRVIWLGTVHGAIAPRTPVEGFAQAYFRLGWLYQDPKRTALVSYHHLIGVHSWRGMYRPIQEIANIDLAAHRMHCDTHWKVAHCQTEHHAIRSATMVAVRD